MEALPLAETERSKRERKEATACWFDIFGEREGEKRDRAFLTHTGKNICLYCCKVARLYTAVKQLFFSRLDGFSLDYAKGLF